jgi:hypothetical protein
VWLAAAAAVGVACGAAWVALSRGTGPGAVPLRPAPAIVVTSPRVLPHVDLALVLENGGVTVKGSAAPETKLRVRWRENGTDDELTRIVTGAFREKVRAVRLESLRIHVGEQVFEAEALLASHAARLVEALARVDWASIQRTGGEVPPAALFELDRMRPVLALALDCVPEELQRRLLVQLWALEALDLSTGSGGRPAPAGAVSLAGAWGEEVSLRPPAPAGVLPGPVRGSIPATGSCVLEWTLPTAPAAAALLTVETDPDATAVLKVVLGDGLEVPIGRRLPAASPSPGLVAAHTRRLPRWAFHSGRNALAVRTVSGAVRAGTVSLAWEAGGRPQRP